MGGIDIDQLNNLAELMKKCLKAKQWDLESKSDEIEAKVNTLARAIGELTDYEDEYEDIDGVKTLVSAPKRVRTANIQNAPDRFQSHVQQFYRKVSKYVEQIRASRVKMYQANFMLVNHVMKTDTSKYFAKGYLALPADDYKMPAAERYMRMLQEVIDNSVTSFQTTQKNSV